MALNNAINAALPISVANGGTGVQTLTNHGVLLGQGTSNVVATAVLTNGQLLIGSTGADPTPATLTAGTGISITPGAGSITIAATGGMPWTEVTTTTQTIAVNNNYVASNAGLVTLTLPSTAAFGDRFIVAGKGAGGWKIAQNSGQTIYFGNAVSTTGVSGFIASTLARDTLEIVCVTANNDFQVIQSVGNLTVS